MIVVARRVLFFPVVYSLVLFAEVYTTAAASLYGFTSRLSVEGTNGFLFVSGAATIASVLLARGIFQSGWYPIPPGRDRRPLAWHADLWIFETSYQHLTGDIEAADFPAV